MRRHRWETKQRQVAREQQAASRAKNLHPAGKDQEESQETGAALPPNTVPDLYQHVTQLVSAPHGTGFDLDLYLRQFTSAPAYLFSGPRSTFTAPTAPLDLPVRQQAEPITAWKRAGIAIRGGQPVLRGVMYGEYKPVDTAIHAPFNFLSPDRHHQAPDAKCVCGFYGVAKEWLYQASKDYTSSSCADLEVELYGRVIRHRDGWRAEKQRVLAVHLDLSCLRCRRPAKGIHQGGLNCGNCHSGIAPTVWFTPAELSSLLGVEVRWQAMP